MKKILLIFILVVSSITLIGCDGVVKDNLEYPSKPNFGNSVTVHDPSIIKDGEAYYAFGSHFAVSQTTDFIRWYQAVGENGASKLYGQDWRKVLSDAVAYVGDKATSTWAPGMIKIENKYYMYYSLSTFGSQTSYIGRVESDNILGPYSNSIEIVKSSPSNGPNTIDAEVFFDNDGRLWMVYGSFFGGIYLKELYNKGENIGLPKESGYGKKIWNGYESGPEGPYIFYNEETEYYYLMASHGSLSTNYNMRVLRSKNVDGPYLDTRDRDGAESSNIGVKLAGNFQMPGQQGLAAMGHNSVIKVDGKYLVIYHARFREGLNGVTGNHNVHVSQLLFDQAGWPVMVPSRYAGESLQEVDKKLIAGKYNILMHSGQNSLAFSESVEYTLEKDGTIKEGGSWEFEGPYYINLKIGIKEYKGILITTYDHGQNVPTLSITALSYRDGMTLWANKKV